MSLELRTRYWDDPAARVAFKKIILDVHRLDFTEWEAAGFWDDAYTPFSLFEDDAIVATGCVYLLDAVVAGRRTRLAQISGMATRADRRGEGLGRRVLDAGLEWARGRHEGVFLFSDEDAVGFYGKYGFVPVEEFVETTELHPVARRDGLVKLDPGDAGDRARIHDYARRRVPVSDEFCIWGEKLLMFHALYTLRDHAYEVPELDCLVFMKRDGGTLKVLDVVGARVPSWNELYPFLAAPDDRESEFHFRADRLGIEGLGRRPLHGNCPFVSEDFPVQRPVFPFTSRA